MLISPHSVREIDRSGRLVYVDVSRQEIKNAPSYNPTVTVARLLGGESMIKWAAMLRVTRSSSMCQPADVCGHDEIAPAHARDEAFYQR